MVMVKGVPQNYCSCKTYYDENDLKRLLNINGTKVADGYAHTHYGISYIFENKSRTSITKAITQLEETGEKLIKMKHPVKELLIICKGINKTEQRLYTRRKMEKKNLIHHLYDRSSNSPIYANLGNGVKLPIALFYESELNK